ncbi:hypothetical protein HRR81_000516 [Exophiala dermatitidis]|nr:hypothetical protein HRR77_000480 [Exophiala dermatitidis]KAJ4581488.1 hypothetical protein HRR79_000516 [Exophiala dermatitidis]KAJ4584710.1 hypothetical protein HRR81_000516 [Exophiala dermatitidis]KAJ4590194.1 hypothetical protein HRR82_000567 [Exophiala dermatitidis]KAJ4621267.1 hypothetical protein HRR85_001477 [Exophiala dermatitidis]
MEDDDNDEHTILSTPTILSLFQERFSKVHRLPRGLRDSWKVAQRASQGSLDRIFLDQGDIPWFVYHLLKHQINGSKTFPNKAKCRKKIAELESVSEDAQKAFANDLARLIPPATVAKVRSTLGDTLSTNLGKRPRMTEGNHESTNYCVLSTRDQTPQQTFLSSDDHVLLDSPLAKASLFYPTYLFEGIKRGPNSTAAVSMTFPATDKYPKPRVFKSICVMANKIEHLAATLFGVHIESNAGLRYVFFPGGAKILPEPRLTLRGCLHREISPYFGMETYRAIAANPDFQEELKQGYDRTNCLWMVITGDASEAATFFLALAPREGTEVKNRLYG